MAFGFDYGEPDGLINQHIVEHMRPDGGKGKSDVTSFEPNGLKGKTYKSCIVPLDGNGETKEQGGWVEQEQGGNGDNILYCAELELGKTNATCPELNVETNVNCSETQCENGKTNISKVTCK